MGCMVGSYVVGPIAIAVVCCCVLWQSFCFICLHYIYGLMRELAVQGYFSIKIYLTFRFIYIYINAGWKWLGSDWAFECLYMGFDDIEVGGYLMHLNAYTNTKLNAEEEVMCRCAGLMQNCLGKLGASTI